MLRKISAYVIGPIIWLIGYGVMILVAVGLWDLSPDNYIPIGTMAYISSAMATYFALEVMSKVHPEISDMSGYFVIAIFALLWVGFSVAYFGRDDEFVFRLISLFLSQVGVLTALRIRLNAA